MGSPKGSIAGGGLCVICALNKSSILMKDITQPKPKKKKWTIDDWMGAIIGFGIISFASLFIKMHTQLGFIPIFFMFVISFWVVKTISKTARTFSKFQLKTQALGLQQKTKSIFLNSFTAAKKQL